LIDSVAKAMAEDFFKRFDLEMQKRYPAAAPAAPAVEERAGVPAWVWVAVAVVIAAIAWFALRH
jgi:hypothetical protein